MIPALRLGLRRKLGDLSFGPWVYVETQRFMFHAWARWFRLPHHHGFGGRCNLRLGSWWWGRGWGISRTRVG